MLRLALIAGGLLWLTRRRSEETILEVDTPQDRKLTYNGFQISAFGRQTMGVCTWSVTGPHGEALADGETAGGCKEGLLSAILWIDGHL